MSDLQFRDVYEFKLKIFPPKIKRWIEQNYDPPLASWRRMPKRPEARIEAYLSTMKEAYIERTGDRYAHWILWAFLPEYLCACIFRGNRIKKECEDRDYKTPHTIGCIPAWVADKVMDAYFGINDFMDGPCDVPEAPWVPLSEF